MDDLLCATARDCRTCHWHDAATGCSLARELDLAVTGATQPALPFTQARIPVALA